MIKKIVRPLPLPLPADWAVLLLRLGTSLLMLRYGYAKLESYLAGDTGFADPFGWGEEASLVLTIGAEVGCSLLLILGAGTRLVLIPLIVTMLVAFFVIHADDPFDQREHPLVFLIPYLALLLTGPGRFSLDQRLFG
ncbi:putative oxidoreductase [Rhabdobacter roseus]|uniref:Putative oxidoreductase n=1 Tax=Rhabdobacter roseus TaxID=1655419 RepID=A0A840TLL7_9BACT|nr:DoxX family protein [Rhabdobacter roseus]MBB5284304.1 putative oxidoreductase [Rhabdobacter roseus]